MPPKRSQNAPKSLGREGKPLLAIQAYQNGQFPSLRAEALRFGVPETTARTRMNRTPFRADKRYPRYTLTQNEEDSLVQWILDMDSRGGAPRPSTVREIANILHAERGSTTACKGPGGVLP
jgi:hypothetical protein